MAERTNNGYRTFKLRYAVAGILAGFLLMGSQSQAASETPLSNLAEGISEITGSGSITNPEKLTDGDKYYLSYDAAGNQNNGQWESYVEDGNSATIGSSSGYIQVDLGASYPIEVINVKMRNYVGQSTFRTGNGDGRMKRLTGTKVSYDQAAVVIGNKADLSDGEVVFYQEGAALPQGVKAPEEKAASAAGLADIGGEWFYMDYSKNCGLDPTEIGTTKTARYVRVYVHSNQASLEFMELGVYGYKKSSEVQKPVEKRRVIDNEHPLMIATAYSDDQLDRNQTTTPGLQGYNTVKGRWNAIPEDLKPYNVLMLHTNNMRQFSPDHIAQAYLQEFYERGLQDGYEVDASIMLMCIGASAVPNGADWYITGCIDYGWLDLMYRKYPNMQGIFCSENGWSGYKAQVATAASNMLTIADRFGGFFVWSELNNVFGYAPGTIKTMLEEHGDAFYTTYKNTEVASHDLQNMSLYQGAWLSDYIGGWGMLSDTWSWDKRFSKLWQGQMSYSGWQRLSGEPEALLGIQMLTTYLNGGCIYTFEFPEVVYGAMDTNSPANEHVISRLFRYFIENPSPSRQELLAETKVMTYGSTSLYPGLSAPETVGFNVLKTGRYGLVPALPTLDNKAGAVAKLAAKVKELNVQMPNVLSPSDAVLTSETTRQKYFQSLYDIQYVGDAFAQKAEDMWFVYNSMVNTNKKQAAVLPVEAHADGRIKTIVAPHTFFRLEEEADGSVAISLNNYRVNKNMWVFDNPQGWNWAGSFAPGQGTLPGKLAVYNYMLTKNVVNAQGTVTLDVLKGNTTLTETLPRLSPDDNEYNYQGDGSVGSTKGENFRTTVFEFTKVTQKPVVRVTAGQQPDTDNQPQYKEPVVTYDAASGKATVSIEHNGWVELSVTNLKYAEDSNAIEIADGVTLEDDYNEVTLTNLASRKTPVLSAAGTSNRLSHATDGTKSEPNYTDPGGNGGGAHWLQVDLGSLAQVEEVKLWRYWSSANREYNDTVILLSPDADFSADKTLVLWNANRNATTAWPKAMDGTGSGTHQLPQGSDSNYVETEAGKTFTVQDSQVHWLDGERQRELPGSRFHARYVRVYMNGSNQGNSNHISELEVWGIEGVIETHNMENLASLGSITLSNPASEGARTDDVTDGTKSLANYTDPGGNTGGPNWIQLDLNGIHKVDEVKMWRYWGDSRQYNDTVILLSTEADFPADKTLVIWNANRDASRNWPKAMDGSAGSHQLPQGSDGNYTEVEAGKAFKVYGSSVKWLDGSATRAVPSQGELFDARYVRVYMNGSSAGNTNHVVELEVNGEQGELVIVDTEPPTVPTALSVSRDKGGNLVLDFHPSSDNYGVDHYEVELTGDAQRSLTLNQTRFVLEGLAAGDYTVTVVAVDTSGNRSDAATYDFNVPEITVEASLPSGHYDTAQSVELTPSEEGGELYYTLDGRRPFDNDGKPTAGAVLYNGAISIERSSILRAAVKKDGQVYSASSWQYVIGEQEAGDFNVPNAPYELQVDSRVANAVILSWSGDEAGVTYHVYVNGVEAWEGSKLQCSIRDLEPLTAYQFYVTAVDAAGNESLRSETVEVITKGR